MSDPRASSDMTLVLFTAAYPYALGGEQNFLGAELPYLLKAFKRVILVPERLVGEQELRLHHVEVEAGYARFLRSQGRMHMFRRGLSSRLVWAEVSAKPWLLVRPAFLKRLIFFAAQAELTHSWLLPWMRDLNIQTASCLLYTYWFDQGTLGIGLAKAIYPELRAISRAHGYDVYEDRQPVPYFPCREAALKKIDRVFSASEAGTRHLRGKYPRFSAQIETHRLGVENPGVLTKPSPDGIYRIVSCSRIVPVKRLPLMMDGIRAAAKRRAAQRFEWCHLGTGELAPQSHAELDGLPSNVAATFLPYTTQADMFEYYRQNCVDVFMNVSASEGTPVSIMEAISCGIPVIASAVGGNVEVVSQENGLLIDANPSPDAIADALLAHWDEPGQRRAGSREVWRRDYDAARNYPDFVKRLVELRQ